MRKKRKQLFHILLFVSILLTSMYFFFYNNYDFKLYNFYTKTFKPYRKNNDVFSAIKYGDIEFLKKLIKQGYSVRCKTISGETPLTFAFDWWLSIRIRGHTFTVKELEEIKQKTYEMEEILIEHGANVNELNGSQESPLYLAIQTRNYKATEILLKNGAQTDILVTYLDRPILYWALINYDIYNDEKYFNLLIDYGANPNIQDEDGNTLLHLAIKEDLSIDTVTLLLKAGLDLTLKNKKNETALDIASRKNKFKYVDLIKKKVIPR